MKQMVTAGFLLKLASFLEKVIYPIGRWLSILSMLSAVAMMFLVTGDVFARRVFNSPIFGAYEAIRILLIIIVFCAVAYVMSVNGHVTVDSLTRLYPKRLRIVIAGVAQILSLLILALMCWRSTVYGLTLMQAGEKMVLLRVPVSPFIFIVAFGCAVLFLVILVQFVYTLAGVGEDSRATSDSC